MKSILLPLTFGLLLAGAAAPNSASAQAASTRPYREGPVVSVSYIRTKPGMFDKYMEYINGPYKQNLEAEKAAGIILDYAIYASGETRNPGDHDVMLTTTYKNWAAFDGLTDRSDAVANRVLQSTVAQRGQQYADRGTMRDVIGGRNYQQLIFSK
jgi:hypothetical protein